MSSSTTGHVFDEFYFATGCGRPYARDPIWLNFFDQIAVKIQTAIQPRSVLEVGCAWGFLVEALRRRQTAAFGVDISTYAIQKVHADIKPYCWVGSLADPLPGRFDLVVCIEVLEHMPQSQSDRAIYNLCQVSDDILFSSTPFDYKEATHYHVRPPEYWAEIFALHGYFRDVDFDASFITPWAVRFRRKSEPTPRLVREYERRFFELWKENADLRSLASENRDLLSELHDRTSQAEQDAAAARQNLELLQASRSWKLLQRLIAIRLRLAPYGSRRERWLKKIGLLV